MAARRSRLNLSDPRLRGGKVTFFPFDGDLRATGPVGGRVPSGISGLTWAKNPGPGGGQYLKIPSGGISTAGPTGLTAAAMGIDGNKARTFFIEYYHANTATAFELFGMGTPGTYTDYTLRKNGANTFSLNSWSVDKNYTVKASGSDAVVRFVMIFDGSNVRARWRSVAVTGASIGTVTRGSSATEAWGALNTPASSEMYFDYWPAVGSSNGDGTSGVVYFGMLGGVAWIDAEVYDFLENPEKLWEQPRTPLLLSAGTVAGATGDAAITLGAATLSAAGSKGATGDASITLGAATLSAVGSKAATGDASITLDAATLSAAGSKGATGDAAITLDAVTLAAAGGGISGVAAVTLGDATLSAAGTKAATGDASITLAAATLSAAGSKGSTGDASITLDAVTLSASSLSGATGTAAITLDAATLSAAGSKGATGDSAVTLGAVTLSAAGSKAAAGAASVTLADAALVAAGSKAATGSASISLGALALTATGTKGATGDAAIALGAVTLFAQDLQPTDGTAAITLGRMVVHSYGLVGTGARMSIREAALGAIATRLSGQLGIPVERGRRSPINADEALPRLVVSMGGHEDQQADDFGTTLLRCTAEIEGYCSGTTDAGLEAAINDLHGRCHASLIGAEITVSSGTGLWVEGRGLVPDAPLLDAAADNVGAFTWTIGFDLRASDEAGPFVTA